MSIQVEITAFLEDSEVRSQQLELERKNEEIKKGIEDNEVATKKSFKQVMGMMRSSYMVISGLAQVMGGTMGEIFTSVYAVAVSTIEVFGAIAAAEFFIPGHQLSSILMTMNLISAMVGLGGIITGQQELSRQMSGLNMALHGVSGMIQSFSI